MLLPRRGMLFVAVIALSALGCGSGIRGLDPNVEVVDVTDRKPPSSVDDGLADDQLADKATSFDPDLIDRRPLEGWRINQSEAVISLNVPMVQPDFEADLLVLHPSYRAAMKAAEHRHPLPSVNLLDGKAKQFDDGLYAAIDLAYFQGIANQLVSHQELVRRLLDQLDPGSPAAPFLAAGLTLGGRDTVVQDQSARDQWMEDFRENPALAKPISFYTWNDSLKRCWAFMRFFQQSFNPKIDEQRAVIAALAQALAGNSTLKTDYEAAARFFGKLTNPLNRLTIADVIGIDLSSEQAISDLQKVKGIEGSGVAFFPPSTSRETELIDRLFPLGVPEGANLLRELVQAIRSGNVDLTPRAESGWYDHQVYALQTMLLPEMGEEHNKLLLTKSYKKRMLEAFAALITKRRETHARQLAKSAIASAEMPRELDDIRPRLRVEPCPSYYLRTARSYAFLENFLTATLGEKTLKTIHGLRQAGAQQDNLATELAIQRDRFYGLYLISCEDIGHKPALKNGEAMDPEACYQAAADWLTKLADEADLAEDTRVAVPIYIDPARRTTRLWVTLGVRLTKLEARFVRAPRLQPANGTEPWQEVEDWKLNTAFHVIPVDEFVEVNVPSLAPPNREELRKLCNEHKTREQIVEALAAGRW
ncbi:MAG: hypothetical protein JSS02_22770 [Planctomycetes bacterium]|nr:hypothetical protein [Planctomycetota bacterium]